MGIFKPVYQYYIYKGLHKLKYSASQKSRHLKLLAIFSFIENLCSLKFY